MYGKIYCKMDRVVHVLLSLLQDYRVVLVDTKPKNLLARLVQVGRLLCLSVAFVTNLFCFIHDLICQPLFKHHI